MVKKRFLLAVFLVAIFLILVSEAFAGCCQGIVGCSRAFFESECIELAAFDSRECEEIEMCDIVACCHDLPGIPKATYRSTCLGMEAEIEPIYIKPFTTNPSAESALANSYCEGARAPCRNVNCEAPNDPGCMCGSASATEANPFCCARDDSVFPSFGACSASPSCGAADFFSIHGQIMSPEGFPIEGAEVRAGGKQVLSDGSGNYTVELLPDLSSGTVVAIKNSTINSTSYSISGADVHGLDIVLDIIAAPPAGLEVCTNGWDDNGNQFNWNSTREGMGDAADRCDVNCNEHFMTTEGRPHMHKTVTKTYYNPRGEYYIDEATGKPKDLCSDGFDNDCDGFADCEDDDCFDTSPACMETFCGDGTIQFPNADGVYEQCDYYGEDGEPLLDEEGEPIGNDSLCPGQCIPPGEERECTCQYEAVCGNGVIDEPLEDCDGMFNAARDIWDPAHYNTGSDCTIDECGKPTGLRPCQCPPPQICGNGVIEEPEECDPGGMGGAEPASGGECEVDQCSPDCTCPPAEAVCGNNILEYGEDCDGTLNLAGNYWDSFKTRKYGCRKDLCSLPRTADSWLTPADELFDDYENYISVMDGVDDECQCPTECKAAPPGPTLNEPEHVRFKREIHLTWEDECINDNAKGYNVFRCEATGPGGEGCTEGGIFNIINEETLGVTTEFDDTTFIGSTTEEARYYCYFIQGVYGDMIADNGVVPKDFADAVDKGKFDPELHCVRAGDEQCFTFHEFYPWADEFCAGYNFNVRSTCDDNNTVVMVEPESPDEKVDCNELVEDFGGFTEYVCVGPYALGTPDEGRTKCVPKSVCDYCNDPFGLFGYSSSTGSMWDSGDFLAGPDFGAAPTRAPTDEMEKRGRLGYVPCIELDFCYMDYSYTNTNRFFAYGNMSEVSCYDFNSLKACQEYNSTIGSGECEWVWHPLFRELGVGVCRTNITEKQQCDRCHDPHNEVFNRCDEDSCALYGRCYYDRNNLVGELALYSSLAEMTAADPVKRAQKESDTAFYRCTHEREIACENYDTRDDCVNSPGPYSIGGSAQLNDSVDIDVSGFMEGSYFNKLDGSNRLETPSDDFFGFGKCEWAVPVFQNTSYFDEEGVMTRNVTWGYAPVCIKNSDDSPPKLDLEESDFHSSLRVEENSDCKGLALEPAPSPSVSNVTDCRKDFVSPSTSIPHYQNLTDPMRISGDFEFPAVVFDSSLDYSTHYPETYACVAEDGLWCYPNGTAENIGRVWGNLITAENVGVNVTYNFSERGFRSGRHIIRYFSEDISHNLERVKNFTVFIDADAPVIVLSWSNVSYEVSEDVWRTNLSLEMSVDSSGVYADEFALCDAKMYLGNASIYPLQDIIGEYNDSWSRGYAAMPDNYYTFWYHCEDDVGNVAEANVTIVIDGDKSLTDPLPRGTFNHGDLTISVETGTNAGCRYTNSTEDLPAFWENRSFDPAVFDTMTTFEVTGSLDSPTTIHRSTVDVGHGYHRYYVKCRMFNDDSYRGNSADQIRFAVDMVPPGTEHRTHVQPYNGWFNQDIIVELFCGDPLVMGNSLDWSFGCDETYYCVGRDCASFEDEWRVYDSPLEFFETSYFSYYSVDQGGNAETPVENVVFQIDKEPPEIDIEFLRGGSPVSVLVMNQVYTIRVSSSKPFISPAISQPSLSYSTAPSKFGDDIELLPTADPAVWEGALFIENINANRGFEGEAIFTASGIDHHNISGSGTASIPIDTKPPDVPVVEPSLEEPSPDGSDYQMMGYPVHYYNGTYYTSQGSLFVTGYTNEFLDMIAVTSVDDVDTEHIFTQTQTDMVYEDIVLSGFAGQHEINIQGDITGRVNSSMYLGFDSEQAEIGPKRDYGAYGMFYDITNAIYRAGDEQYTSVTIYPVLEESLKLDREIFFYDKETPSFWFGFDLPMAGFQNTTVYLKSYDDAGNLVRYPEISREYPFLTFFSDPVAPVVLSHYPRDGSTSRTTMDIEVVVKEGKDQSGLWEEAINFSINGEPVTYHMEHVPDLEAVDPDNDYYRIYYPASNLDDGVYDVSVEGYDLAVNGFSEDIEYSHWTFIVDRSLPADPIFSLIGGSSGPPGSTRWYVDHSPDFIVDFSAEPNPVTLVDVMMEDSPTEGGAADCTNTSYNVFRCEFTAPKTTASGSGVFWADYGVIIRAFKTLDDGTSSNNGDYGPFRFTVDDQAPDFVPAFQTRFMDNINLTIGAVVSNEHHPLHADLEIFGESHAPIYSSNNGSFYYFVWEVPDYDKDREGPASASLTLSDFAGNARSVTVPVFVDLTAPRIENMSVDVSHTVRIGREVFTSNPEVTITGSFIDDDIDKVWVEPGDFDSQTGTLEGKKYADLRTSDGVAESFELKVNLVDPEAGNVARAPFLYNFMLINQINNMTLYVRDKAGHVSHRQLRVITDIAPPAGPTFCLGEDWYDCIPPMGGLP